MDDQKTPVESALDVFVYAPIGLVFDGPAGLAKLVQQGRNQVAMARTIGQFAVQQGQVEASKTVARLTDSASGVLGGIAGERSAASPPSGASTSAPAKAPKAAEPATTAAPSSAAAPSTPPPAVDDLAIPDYDSLSASQVVSRLAGLATDELVAVATYEAAGRGRKTVLNKVAQLQRS